MTRAIQSRSKPVGRDVENNNGGHRSRYDAPHCCSAVPVACQMRHTQKAWHRKDEAHPLAWVRLICCHGIGGSKHGVCPRTAVHGGRQRGGRLSGAPWCSAPERSSSSVLPTLTSHHPSRRDDLDPDILDQDVELEFSFLLTPSSARMHPDLAGGMPWFKRIVLV